MSIAALTSGYQPFSAGSVQSLQPRSSFQEGSASGVALAESTSQAANITSDPVRFSTSTTALLLQQQEVDTPEISNVAQSGTTYAFGGNTTQGTIDFDEYFAPPQEGERINLQDVPLLLPSAENISALSDYASSRLSKALDAYGISAPQTITYNNNGELQLPDDYAHAEEFEQLLSENPKIERALSTVNALTSHYVELQKVADFQQEYAATHSQAQAQAVLERYSYLFGDNRDYSHISLSLTPDGIVSLNADDQPLRFS